MEILSVSQKTLSELGDLEAVSSENFSKICKYFLQVIMRGHTTLELEDNLGPALSAVSTVLLESARVRASNDQIRALFTEHAITGDNASIMIELYDQHKDNIITHLEATGIAAPSIVDLDWRLDYSVRSKHGGRNNIPMYFVSLKVRDRGLLRNVDMIASLEEMQDLLSSVKDAVKEVGRVLNATE